MSREEDLSQRYKMADIKRAVAAKVPIRFILDGNYVKEDEEFTPNYIEYDGFKISRANIIAIVLNLESGSMLIDDNTGRISVRGFEQNSIPDSIAIGDIVTVIGRPRDYGSEKYIVPEIIKKTDSRWMKLRKLEIRDRYADASKPPEEKIATEEIEDTPGQNLTGKREQMISYIKSHDDGKGVLIDKIVSESSIAGSDQLIEEMLKEGDLFENLPGKVRILE